MVLDQKTQLNMVIGYPLAQTQSPRLHQLIYQELNYNAVLLAVANDDLSVLMTVIRTLSVGLVAVTMPFKAAVLSQLDYLDDEAKALGAVNTILYREEKLLGYNTDIAGIAYALRHETLAHKKVLVIGAGGAARAVGYYLQQNKAQLFWVNRSEEKALALKNQFGGQVIPWPDKNHCAVDIIINTTSLGMFPETVVTPLPGYTFQAHQVVFDLVYNPIETALLKQAQAHGAKTIMGLDMFVWQGIRQVELWLNKETQLLDKVEYFKSQLMS